MNILVELNHPAHFHLFRNAITAFRDHGHSVLLVTMQKDVLMQLVLAYEKDGTYIFNRNKNEKGKGTFKRVRWLFESDWKMFLASRKFKPDIYLSSGFSFAHIGWLLGKPTLHWTEDDSPYHWRSKWITNPVCTNVLMPECSVHDRWQKKTVYYPSFHELAYISPATFQPDKSRIKGLVDVDKPFYILRLSGWSAHHDVGLHGLSFNDINSLIGLLSKTGNVYITSERPLIEELEPYRISVHPAEIHHALYYAQMVIGDSLTVIAEAALMGTPTILFSDFVGKQGYINDLQKRGLIEGISGHNAGLLLDTVAGMLAKDDLRQLHKERSREVLRNSIDLNAFMIWFTENFPKSRDELAKHPERMKQFAFSTTEYTELS